MAIWRSSVKQILVIDDDLWILKSMQLFLTHLGYKVKVAGNGREGLSLFSDGFHFDLVITDIKMPAIDGNDVARCVRNSDKPDTPVVAITGFANDVNRGLFNLIIEKPFKLDALAEAITSLMP
jgi:CheY-like chemotaxis protein